ncbi:MAG: substrate-binding domain-containing protein [Pseudomonadota bacterium]
MVRALVLALSVPFIATTVAAEDFIIVQSTTSTQNSGLYETLTPKVLEETGIEIRVVAVGTGQALKNARNCDGDVLLVHAKADEQAFVANGFGTERTDLMYNDFVIVGPKSDPAGIAGFSADDALATIRSAGGIFTSRGDDSGTHKAEMRLWAAVGIDPSGESGTWYRETGSGMGATLNIAVGLRAYTLTDRATWIRFQNKSSHAVLVEGDPALFNQYGIVAINPEACPNIRAEMAQIFIDWMLSDQGQAAIAAHKVNGQQLFFPNAPR